MKKTFQQVLDSDESVAVQFKPKSFEVIRVGRSNVDTVIDWVEKRGGKAVEKSGTYPDGFSWAGFAVYGPLNNVGTIVELGDYIRFNDENGQFSTMTFLALSVDCVLAFKAV